MARIETDCEDLLREATALVDRAELRVAGEAEPVTVGFRKGGALSVYFGGEAVYQFNAAGQLRRAFVDGLLYKSERGRLVALRRERTPTQVVLQSTQLGDAETTALVTAARDHLRRLELALDQGTFELVGQVTTISDFVSHLRQWLARMPQPWQVATRPNVG